MNLTADQIATIAEWQPTQMGFGRDDAQTGVRIHDIVDRIQSTDDLGCELLEEDGISNYFVLFAYLVADVPSFAPERRVEGLLIYLSACAPVGVVGRSHKCVGPGLSSHDPLEIEMLLAPDHPNGLLEEKTVQAIRSGGYELLTVEEASQRLPPGVKPFEYCYGREPWDRVFHALFANTD